MKFTNIAAAFTLFASSYTYAATLPAGEDALIASLLERFEQNEQRL